MHINDYLSPFMLPQLSPNRGHGGLPEDRWVKGGTTHLAQIISLLQDARHSFTSIGGGVGWGS